MKPRKTIKAVLVVIGAFLLFLLACLPIKQWWELQRLGHVPEGVSRGTTREDYDLWRVAEWTTWWGKPLDPETFWKGRVMWNDRSALSAANRYGRGYPPIPMHVPNLITGFPLGSYSHADIPNRLVSGGPDSGRGTPFDSTEAEGIYWTWFWMKKPKPPETLEREQFQAAEMILRIRKRTLESGEDVNAHTRAKDQAKSESFHKGRAREIGVPAEALTEDALFWAYVMKQREAYKKEQAQADRWRSQNNQIADAFVKRFLEKLAVNTKLVTEPLTVEQIETATRWKYAYLKRLRSEKTDDSYINAYVETWKLDRAVVFGEKDSK
ncbi:MAG: hypothetical protein HOP33_18095 [Verrucomicrobia bacterium]|nr:hypothetical protein [Verrucomicrobiota bacterium]